MKKKKFLGGYKRIVASFAAVMMAVSMIGDAVPIMTASAASLPTSIDMTNEFPTPGDQGSQGSCVAWAAGYALKSHQEHMEHGWGFSTNKTIYSPAYIYNQLEDSTLNGLSIPEVLDFIVEQGVCSLYNMGYAENDWTTQPNDSQKEIAANFKADSWSMVNGIDEIKESLAQHEGVLVSIKVYSDLRKLSKSNPTYDKINTKTYEGNHTVCLIGYDDSKQRFKFINSWGTDWGIDGYGYISYSMFNKLNNDPSDKGGYGYVLMDDTHTDSGNFITKYPGEVKTKKEIRAYKLSDFYVAQDKIDNFHHTIPAGKTIKIEKIVLAKNGVQPYFLTKDGYYITTMKDSVLPVQYAFEAKVNDGKGGTISGSKNRNYYYNNSISVEAKAKEGYAFIGWSKSKNGSIINTSTTYSFNITKKTTIYANFEPITIYEKTAGSGDVNGDGKIDIVDVIMVRAYIIGNISLEGNQLLAADVNGDANIDIIDVTILRQKIAAN